MLETLSYAITLAYSYRNEFPFSTYGENFFLTIQNILITLLIIYFPNPRLTRAAGSVGPRLAVASTVTAATSAALYYIPSSSLAALQVATIPLSLFSKIPHRGLDPRPAIKQPAWGPEHKGVSASPRASRPLLRARVRASRRSAHASLMLRAFLDGHSIYTSTYLSY